MNIWMIGKILMMKLHSLKKKIFTGIWVWKDFTNADDTLEKRLCKDFKIKNLEEFHNFYVQSDKLLLADVFQNFRNMSWNI